jgi:hypothetical protein
VLVRNALFRRVELVARGDADALAALGDTSTDGTPWDAAAWERAVDGYFAEYEEMGIGPTARSAALLTITQDGRTWHVRQVFDDPLGDRDWAITADVDLDASDAAGAVVLHVIDVGPHR